MVGSLFETVTLEIQPVTLDIDGDGAVELLVVASESSSFKVPGIGPGIEKSWVAVVKYRNGDYDKGHLTFERENPLQGLWAEDGKVYLIESKTSSTLSEEEKSKLLVYPITPTKQ